MGARAIQARIDAASAVATTKAAWLNAVKTYDAIDLQVTVLMRELRNLVIAAFGSSSPKLADFGFKATVRTPLTPAQKVARAAKAKATRVARGTLGKKQKALITGATAAAAASSATAPTTTPAATPAPAPAAPAPAAPAPAAPAAPAAAPAMRDLRKLAAGLFGPGGAVTEALGVKAPRAKGRG
jgi:hypothetical protein